MQIVIAVIGMVALALLVYLCAVLLKGDEKL